jgi:hypothetical protein
LVGKVTKGFLKNWTVVRTAIFLNNDPSACYSKEGLCQLDIFFSQITFINSKGEKIICTGTGTDTYNPCLRN